MLVIFGLLAVVSVIVGLFLLAPPAILSDQKPLLLFAHGEGFQPNHLQRILGFGLWAASVVIAGLFWLNVKSITDDFNQWNRTKVEPPNLGSDAIDPRQAMIDAYSRNGFKEHSVFQGEGDAELKLLTRVQLRQDSENFWRQDGAVVYPDGSGTNFSVAVLLNDDSWKFDDEILVQRRRMGKPVQIETALKLPEIREVIQLNDYILGIGLASYKSQASSETNEKKAHARAYNIGLAVFKLGLKPANRIATYSLGHATKPADPPSLDARQRSVVIIGVNASRDVNVADVLDAASKMVTLRGLDLSAYSFPPANSIRLTKPIEEGSKYMRASNLADRITESPDIYHLPAVKQD